MITLYHKSNCSTSLKALALLKAKKQKVELVHYIDAPPDAETLQSLLTMLGIKAEQLVRKKESLYKEKYLGKKISNAQWIKILIKNPILIERPIAIMGNKAVIGRPPEKILELLKK